MVSQRIDEREHRRGLVLGLTLAETLLLLLFLLLLTLGVKLAAMKRAMTPLPVAQHMPSWNFPTNPTIAEPFTPAPGSTGVVIGSPIETGSIGPRETGSFASDNSKPQPDASDVALQGLKGIAIEFNPSDPPAILKRMQDILAGLPHTASALDDLQHALHDLDQRKPNSALDQLKMAVAILKRLPPDALPDDVIVRPKPTAGNGDGKEHPDWPPIITLTEADGFFFPTGSAELAPAQRDKLAGPVVDALAIIIDKYSDVNVIEVIGHTDEQPIGRRPSNLDGSLFPRLQGNQERPEMIPADNAGLGLARAVAVAEVLLQQKRLTKFRILPLSGAQLIDLNDDLSGGSGPKDMESRRRIEIRVRRSERGASNDRYERKPLSSIPAKPKSQDAGDWNPFQWKF